MTRQTLTIREASRITGISGHTLRRMMRRGELAGYNRAHKERGGGTP